MNYVLVSIKDRRPAKWTTVFIIIDGRKDIVSIPWIDKHCARWPEHEFHWLEPQEEFPLKHKKSGPKPKPKPKKEPYQFGSGRPPSDKD